MVLQLLLVLRWTNLELVHNGLLLLQELHPLLQLVVLNQVISN